MINAFREAVLVEYPRRGIWAIAFITGRTEGEVQNITEEECINIFLPTTPNPTSGFLLFVPQKDLIRLDMSVEEAIKMVISGGIVTPPDRRSEAEKTVSLTSAQTYENLDVLREKERAPVLSPRAPVLVRRRRRFATAPKRKRPDDLTGAQVPDCGIAFKQIEKSTNGLAAFRGQVGIFVQEKRRVVACSCQQVRMSLKIGKA